MSYTNPTAMELLMHDRVAERLHEAEQDRLTSLASRGPAMSGVRRGVIAPALALVRLLSSLF